MRRLTATSLALVLVACSSAIEPTPTVPRPTATPNLNWLTDARQERLADAVETLRIKHGWAAGGVFRWNADESVLQEFSRPDGTAAFSFVSEPELRPAVVMYVEAAVKASGSYREHLSAASFCYVPE